MREFDPGRARADRLDVFQAEKDRRIFAKALVWARLPSDPADPEYDPARPALRAEVVQAFDACDETSDSCAAAPDAAACDDGAYCNGAETCDLLLGCSAGPPPCGGLACDEGLQACVEAAFAGAWSGSSVSSARVVTSAPVGGGDRLYLAAISARGSFTVTGVSGLGLLWTHVLHQCGGRGQTGLSLWMARGEPSSSEVVAAELAASVESAVIAVASYAGAHATAPIGAIVAGNSRGVNGACSGGTDANSYSFSLPVGRAGAIAFGAVALRNRTHTAGAGLVERAEIAAGNGGGRSGGAIEDRNVPAPAAATLSGTFNGKTDFAFVGVEVRPAGP
jgi:hypothetical protein